MANFVNGNIVTLTKFKFWNTENIKYKLNN